MGLKKGKPDVQGWKIKGREWNHPHIPAKGLRETEGEYRFKARAAVI